MGERDILRSILVFCFLPALCEQVMPQIQPAFLYKNSGVTKGSSPMSLEENKAIARRVYELSTNKDFPALFERSVLARFSHRVP